jgi:hypothetical protein
LLTNHGCIARLFIFRDLFSLSTSGAFVVNLRSLAILPICIAVCSLILTSCATVFKGSTDTVVLNSRPPGAIVKINGTQRGTTPLTLELESNKPHNVLFIKDGFEEEYASITHSVAAGYVILDIIFILGFVPLIVDAATGNWNTLDQRELNIVLTPAKK